MVWSVLIVTFRRRTPYTTEHIFALIVSVRTNSYTFDFIYQNVNEYCELKYSRFHCFSVRIRQTALDINYIFNCGHPRQKFLYHKVHFNIRHVEFDQELNCRVIITQRIFDILIHIRLIRSRNQESKLTKVFIFIYTYFKTLKVAPTTSVLTSLDIWSVLVVARRLRRTQHTTRYVFTIILPTFTNRYTFDVIY